MKTELETFIQEFTKDFVSHKIAILLEEKNFNLSSMAYFDKKGNIRPMIIGITNDDAKLCLPDGCVVAPLIQNVIEWLDEKNLRIIPTYSSDIYGFEIQYICGNVWNINWTNRNQSMLAGIEEALKHL